MTDTFPLLLPPFVSARRSPSGLPPGWSLSIPDVSTHYLILPDAVFESDTFARRFVGKRLAEYCGLFGKGEEFSAWESAQ